MLQVVLFKLKNFMPMKAEKVNEFWSNVFSFFMVPFFNFNIIDLLLIVNDDLMTVISNQLTIYNMLLPSIDQSLVLCMPLSAI